MWVYIQKESFLFGAYISRQVLEHEPSGEEYEEVMLHICLFLFSIRIDLT